MTSEWYWQVGVGYTRCTEEEWEALVDADQDLIFVGTDEDKDRVERALAGASADGMSIPGSLKPPAAALSILGSKLPPASMKDLIENRAPYSDYMARVLACGRCRIQYGLTAPEPPGLPQVCHRHERG